MSTMTTVGRTAIAAAFKESELYLAWGSGEASWDTSRPPPERSATALAHEVGRRKIRVIEFCKPQDDGEIITAAARYTRSDSATPNLFLRTEFDFNDGIGATIRELGIFSGCELQEGLEKGKTYFAPQEVKTSGTLIAVDNIAAIARGTGSRLTIDFILTF